MTDPEKEVYENIIGKWGNAGIHFFSNDVF